MRLSAKATLSAIAAAALVLACSLPAQAAPGKQGSFSCGGPAFPTAQYKNNGYTEAVWRVSEFGAYLRGPAQFGPNVAVYYQSPRKTPASFYRVAYGAGTSFAHFNAICS